MPKRRHWPFLLVLLLSGAGIVVGFLHPSPADAFTSNLLPRCTEGGNCGLEDFIDLFTRAYSFGLSILGALSLFFFVYGGFLWLISGGNQDRIAQGKRILSGTLLGVVIGLTSWLVVNVVVALLVTKPDEPVDFTKVEINGHPWWNFWSNIPTGCCIGTTFCTDRVTEAKCEQEFNGAWKGAGSECGNETLCRQGCCVPSNVRTTACRETDVSDCSDGTFLTGITCTDVSSGCTGCRYEFSFSLNTQTCTENAPNPIGQGGVQWEPGSCDQSRCPGDTFGCCTDAGTCTENVRKSSCGGTFQDSPCLCP